MENENMPVNNVQDTALENTEQPVEAQTPAEPKVEKTFTQDELNNIVGERLERAKNSLYEKHGVKNADELEALFEKAKGYEALKTERDDFAQQISFLKNNIKPDRYEDVKTYFKGKEMPFDDETLKSLLITHPEWVNKAEEKTTPQKTTISKLGSEQSSQPKITEKELAEQLFGMKFR